LLEHIDSVTGLPDRQLVLLLCSLVSALSQDDDGKLQKAMFPELSE
tara:strand:+ start:3007 stop:3144 length:138 start_codon:yes stop_codon:yes gene_type:complete